MKGPSFRGGLISCKGKFHFLYTFVFSYFDRPVLGWLIGHLASEKGHKIKSGETNNRGKPGKGNIFTNG